MVRIIVVDSISEAVEISNRIAPEHLELVMDNPFEYLGMVEKRRLGVHGQILPGSSRSTT